MDSKEELKSLINTVKKHKKWTQEKVSIEAGYKADTLTQALSKPKGQEAVIKHLRLIYRDILEPKKYEENEITRKVEEEGEPLDTKRENAVLKEKISELEERNAELNERNAELEERHAELNERNAHLIRIIAEQRLVLEDNRFSIELLKGYLVNKPGPGSEVGPRDTM